MSALRWFLVAALASPLLAGCGSSSAPKKSYNGRFPAGSLSVGGKFIFGASVAGFQVDMGCPTLPKAQCDDPNSDWYQFVTSPVTVNDPKDYLSGESPR